MEVRLADDTNFYLSHKNIDKLFASMNVEVDTVSTWLESNKLSLNVDKTNWLLFHPLSKRQLLLQNLPNLLMENMKKGTCNNLSWKQQTDIVSSKISKSIDILYKSRDILSKKCLKQLYFSFIHNYVNFANIARPSTSISKLERLYRCQEHAARVIYHKDWYAHASPLLNDMKSLNVFQLIL